MLLGVYFLTTISAFASPCCQGHSLAAGKARNTVKADVSRSTAWAVVSAAETAKAPVYIIENVKEFLSWQLYSAWELAMKSLGYAISVNFVDGRNLEIPQNRQRLFLVATRSKKPIELKLPKFEHIPAREIIDLNMEGYKWSKVSSRVAATQLRVKNGRKQLGEIFIDSAYGSARTGRSIDKPLGTVKTVNVHSLVIGDQMRALTVKELAAAQTFPDDYIWPKIRYSYKINDRKTPYHLKWLCMLQKRY